MSTGPGESGKIDAAIVPVGYKGIAGQQYLNLFLRKEFGPAMGVDLADPRKGVYMKYLSGNRILVTADHSQAEYMPKDHPTHPLRERYSWHERGDGVLLGTKAEYADYYPTMEDLLR